MTIDMSNSLKVRKILLSKIDEFAEYEDGWDGGGAFSAPIEVIEFAKELVSDLPESALNSIRHAESGIDLTTYGTFVIHWPIPDSYGVLAEIECSNSGFSGFMYKRKSRNEAIIFEKIQSVKDLPIEVFQMWLDLMKDEPYFIEP